MKKVSICIPTYEQPKNLQKCLESIKIQNYKNFEVIITDDSKSNSLELIAENFQQFFDIKYIKNMETKGSPENWNESLKYATGDYIKILHHDDRFKNETSLEKFVALIEENENINVVFCSSYHIDSNGNYISSHILNPEKLALIEDDPKKLFLGNIIGAPSVVMYKSSITETFDKRLKWLVDLDFYIRVLEENRFAYTSEELIEINIVQENRVTQECINDRKINIYEMMIVLEKLSFVKISWEFKLYILRFFLKFNIASESDIHSIGYDNKINEEIKKILKFVRILQPLYKIFKFIKLKWSK